MLIRQNNYLISLFDCRRGKVENLPSPKHIPTIKDLLEYKTTYLRVLNMTDVSHSMRFNPIQLKYIPTLQDSMAFADNILESFWNNAEATPRAFQLYKETAKDFFAACIWFFMNYKKLPYDEDGKELWPEYYIDRETDHKRLTGRAFDTKEHRDEAMSLGYSIGERQPAYWLGKYSDLAHILAFLCHEYIEVLEVLKTDIEAYTLIEPLKRIYDDRDVELLDLALLPLRTFLNKFQNKEAYWIFHKDGDDFDLSNKWDDNYIMIVYKSNQQTLLKLTSLLFGGTVSDDKEWSYTKDDEFSSDAYDCINKALNIRPYEFASANSMERILYVNYNRVMRDMDEMIKEILYSNSK